MGGKAPCQRSRSVPYRKVPDLTAAITQQLNGIHYAKSINLESRKMSLFALLAQCIYALFNTRSTRRSAAYRLFDESREGARPISSKTLRTVYDVRYRSFELGVPCRE